MEAITMREADLVKTVSKSYKNDNVLAELTIRCTASEVPVDTLNRLVKNGAIFNVRLSPIYQKQIEPQNQQDMIDPHDDDDDDE